MAVTNIGVVNYSSTPDTEVGRWATAVQTQMHDDVAPAWGIAAPNLNLVSADTNPSGIDSWIVVVNDAQQRIGLGYHELYHNQPIGYVLVEYTKADGQTPSRVFSHEVLEMAIDPDMIRQTDPIDGIRYLVEAGDILSFDQGGYEVDGVLVSGFGTPAYFRLENGTVFGIRNNLPGPLPATAPPEMGTMLCWFENGLLRSKFPALAAPPRFMTAPHSGSRRFRRTIPRAEWRDRQIPPTAAQESSQQSATTVPSGSGTTTIATPQRDPGPQAGSGQPPGAAPPPATSEPSWAKPTIAIFWLAVFALALIVVWKAGKDAEAAFNLLIGAVIANLTTIVGYYFGSSSGSTQKTALLASTTPPRTPQ